jgi:hypothetical protein
MCSVSAVSEYYQRDWMQRNPTTLLPWQSDPVVQQLLREVITRLDQIDKRLGDIECNEPAKEAFLKDLGLDI